MSIIVVRRKGIIWFDDYYEVDEITEKTIKDCIDDNYADFIESDVDWDTLEPTDDIEVTNIDTGEILYDTESREITIPNHEKD